MRIILVLIGLLVIMEGAAWRAYQSSQKPDTSEAEEKETAGSQSESSSAARRRELEKSERERIAESDEAPAQPDNDSIPVSIPASPPAFEGIADYPLITTEEKNGRTERTIHMGVRKYAWDPDALRVKQGEFVRLVIHNADVLHGIVIPELGIQADIPEGGAVVEFTASKKGSYRLFCSVYCGEGHMEMQATLIVE